MSVKKYKLTPEHQAALGAWRDRWIANAMSTEAMTEADREACREAVNGMYAAANLPLPKRIVFVPSPFVLRFAGGFAASIWSQRRSAGDTGDATKRVTEDATWEATWAATWAALSDAASLDAEARQVLSGPRAGWSDALTQFSAVLYVQPERFQSHTFFFRADLEVSLNRILDGRPELKYFEAGMDIGFSPDPYESFRIFQGRMLEEYLAMSREFSFNVIDANETVETQQAIVRKLVDDRIDLPSFALHKS